MHINSSYSSILMYYDEYSRESTLHVAQHTLRWHTDDGDQHGIVYIVLKTVLYMQEMNSFKLHTANLFRHMSFVECCQ